MSAFSAVSCFKWRVLLAVQLLRNFIRYGGLFLIPQYLCFFFIDISALMGIILYEAIFLYYHFDITVNIIKF